MKSERIMVCMRWHLKTRKRYSIKYRAQKGVLAAQLFFKVPGLQTKAKASDCSAATRDIILKKRNWERKHSHCKALSYVKMHFFFYNEYVWCTLKFFAPEFIGHFNLLQAAGSWENGSQFLAGYLVLWRLPETSSVHTVKKGRKHMRLFQFFPDQTNESSLLSKEFKSQEEHFPITTE